MKNYSSYNFKLHLWAYLYLNIYICCITIYILMFQCCGFATFRNIPASHAVNRGSGWIRFPSVHLLKISSRSNFGEERPGMVMNHGTMGMEWGYHGLVGGLVAIFSHILAIIIPTDFHIFQRGSNHQPVMNNEWKLWWHMYPLGLSYPHDSPKTSPFFFANLTIVGASLVGELTWSFIDHRRWGFGNPPQKMQPN